MYLNQDELFNNLKAYINLGWRRELEGLSLSFFVVVVVALAEVSSVELGSTVARSRYFIKGYCQLFGCGSICGKVCKKDLDNIYINNFSLFQLEKYPVFTENVHQ